MATVLERFNRLGLCYNKEILTNVGIQVSAHFNNQEIYKKAYARQSIKQIEDGDEIIVWDYCDTFVPVMDNIILEYVNRVNILSRG